MVLFVFLNMFKPISKAYKILITICAIAVIGGVASFVLVKKPLGFDKLEIGREQKKSSECYSPNPSWIKVADTTVRDIMSTHSATVNKDIYCDDYNCLLWADEAAAPATVCAATDSNVYANILWAKTDVDGTKRWTSSDFAIGEDDIGGTHPSGLTAGSSGKSVENKNWLAIDYASSVGTFNAQDACKALGSGWRLPTILELDSIRDQTKDSSSYSQLPNIRASNYWSSSEADIASAYFLTFNLGDIYTSDKSSNLYVRCVKGQ